MTTARLSTTTMASRIPMTMPSTTSRHKTTQTIAAPRLRGLAAWLSLVILLCLGLSTAPVAHSQTSLPVVIADFNHDGIPDVLVPSNSGPTATIAFGTVPFGTFSTNARGVSFPAACTGLFPDLSIGQLIAGDFNGDGIPDLFFSCGSASTGILLGVGDGTFGAPILLSGTSAVSGALATDFNHDGKLDLALIGSADGGQTTGILFYSGNGDGTFAAPVVSPFGTTANFSSSQVNRGVLSLDVDGDGYPDIVLNAVFAQTTAVFSVFGNNKDGTFGTPAQATRIPNTSVVLGTATAVRTFTIQTGDFFGSNNPDILFSNSGSAPGTILLQNTSTASTFSFATPVLTPYTGFQGVKAASFTGSGFTDLAIANGATISVFANDGTGNFSPTYTTLSFTSTNALIGAADANGDGYSDIYTATSGTGGALQLAVQIVDGTATATSQPVSLTSTGTKALSASWPGNINITGSTATSPLTVNGTTPTVLLSSSANPSIVGDTVNFTAQVSAPSSANAPPTPTGTVILLDGTQTFANGTLSDTGSFQFPLQSLSTGTHNFTVQYAGDTFYSPATSLVYAQVVNPASAITPALVWPASADIPYGTPLSSVQLNASATTPDGSSAVAGTYVYTPPAGTVLPVGSQVVRVLFTPTDTVTYTTATTGHLVNVLPSTPTTALTLSANSVPSGTVVTFTASVAQGTIAIPVGQVNLCDAAATFCTDIHLFGTAQLTSAGTATFKFIPGIGTRTYKAVFAGTTSAATATSPTATLTVTGTYPTATSIAQSGTVGNYTLAATTIGTGGNVAPTGTISFLDTSNSNAPLATATVGAVVSALSIANVSASSPTGREPTSVAVGDFNGDGKPDLAIADLGTIGDPSTGRTVTILLGNGDGSFTAAPSLAAGNGPSAIGVADFNGDGRQDLAVTNSIDNTVAIFLGNGDGTFATATTASAGSGPFSIATADFDGDGNADLAITNSGDTTLTILLGHGDGTFSPAVSPSTGYNPVSVAVGDFNQDGHPDLAIANGDNTLTILLGAGDGTFTPAAALATPGNGNDGLFNTVVVADFNGDGKPDLIATSVNSNGPLTLTLFLGKGDGTFTTANSFASDQTYSQSVHVGDFNGDGRPDLAVANDTHVTILLNNGDNTFTAAASVLGATTTPDYFPSAVADFNGDGIPDIATASSDADAVQVLLTQITQTVAATAIGIAPLGTGSHQVVASYPGDALYAASQSTPTPLTGQAIAPALTWTPAVSTIPYGTPLGAQQLNAVAIGLAGAALPGTFAYTPAAGTILAPGASTLSVLFTPTDLVDYTPFSATTQVTVTAPTLIGLTPATAPLGSAATRITLAGSGFVPTSVVLLNGAAIPTSYVSPASLTAIIPAASLTQIATLQVAVSTPALTAVTSSLPFTVLIAGPAVTVTAPPTTQPGTQPSVALTLANPYPIPLSATFTLGFASAVSSVTDDPSIQFASGGRTATFTIPANTVTVPAIQLQAGTVAGTITVPLTLAANNINVTPTPQPVATIVVPRAVPTVSTTTITRAPGQLSVAIHGFSNTRDVTTATFHFVAAPGATISTPDITAPVTPLFTTWFTSATSAPYGSTFTYTQVFNVSDDPANIGSVTVTLTNSVGTSTTQTAQ